MDSLCKCCPGRDLGGTGRGWGLIFLTFTSLVLLVEATGAALSRAELPTTPWGCPFPGQGEALVPNGSGNAKRGFVPAMSGI